MGRGISVHGWSRYSRNSVLAGQPLKRWLAAFDTVAEALAEFPDATPNNTFTEPKPYLGHLPDGPDL